jgi:hypothetical protein
MCRRNRDAPSAIMSRRCIRPYIHSDSYQDFPRNAPIWLCTARRDSRHREVPHVLRQRRGTRCREKFQRIVRRWSFAFVLCSWKADQVLMTQARSPVFGLKRTSDARKLVNDRPHLPCHRAAGLRDRSVKRFTSEGKQCLVADARTSGQVGLSPIGSYVPACPDNPSRASEHRRYRMATACLQKQWL